MAPVYGARWLGSGRRGLAPRAEMGATPSHPCLGDRRPAARPGLPVPSVARELARQAAAVAVGTAVVPERRALARDPEPQRLLDALAQPSQLVVVEAPGRAEWIEARVPERLVDIDVP